MNRMTVHDLLATKGRRKLTKLAVQTPEQVLAAQAVGIDVLTARYTQETQSLRRLAPDPFFVFGLRHGETVTADEELCRAFKAREEGADAVYCPMRMDVVEHLSIEGIPVVGHVGLVPRRSTWTGGLRPVGKNAEEALAVFEAVKAYENAGAVAVEMELVPARVATEITKRTTMIVFSMGSGGDCDGDFLFASDILGETEGHIPRHARKYRDLRAEYARLNQLRREGFAAFQKDVATGSFPNDGEIVKIQDAEWDRFIAAIG